MSKKVFTDDTIILAYWHYPWQSFESNPVGYVMGNIERCCYYWDDYCDKPSLVYVMKLSAAKSELLQELYAR